MSRLGCAVEHDLYEYEKRENEAYQFEMFIESETIRLTEDEEGLAELIGLYDRHGLAMMEIMEEHDCLKEAVMIMAEKQAQQNAMG